MKTWKEKFAKLKDLKDQRDALFCEHHDWQMMARLGDNGHKYFVKQCTICGMPNSTWVKYTEAAKTYNIEELPEFDDASAKAWEEQREANYAKWFENWRANYEEYLASPEWKEKRAAAMATTDGLCMICIRQGKKELATEVHHMSYEHVGHERLNELMPMCKQHHKMFHELKSRRDKIEREWASRY